MRLFFQRQRFWQNHHKPVCSQSGSRCRLPPCASTIPLEILSPSPVPGPATFVVKNGCPSLSRIFFGIPLPLSVTESSRFLPTFFRFAQWREENDPVSFIPKDC